MEKAPKPFWMIVGIGQGSPSMKHDSIEKAETEAKRLARNNPGVTFVVLQAVSAVTKREFDTITFRGGPARDGCERGCDLPF